MPTHPFQQTLDEPDRHRALKQWDAAAILSTDCFFSNTDGRHFFPDISGKLAAPPLHRLPSGSIDNLRIYTDTDPKHQPGGTSMAGSSSKPDGTI